LTDVALALFAEHGYDGTSTRLIAAAAGVTEGLIFKYFPTKRDLLRAVFERHAPTPEVEEVYRCVEGLPIGEALELWFRRMAEHLWEKRLFVRMVIMESYRQGEAFHEFVALMERVKCFLGDLLAERVAKGEIVLADTDAAEEMLRGAVFAFFLRHQHRGEEEWRLRSRLFIREMVRLFLQGAKR
jgi:AcrR family transcriptional regulator